MPIALIIRNISRSNLNINYNCTIQAIINIKDTSKYTCSEDELEYESKCASLYANRILGYDLDIETGNTELKTAQNVIIPKIDTSTK